MPANPGYCPDEARGKRVQVTLANGMAGTTDGNPMSPLGWPADGRNGCRWTLTGFPFDIKDYEVIE